MQIYMSSSMQTMNVLEDLAYTIKNIYPKIKIVIPKLVAENLPTAYTYSDLYHLKRSDILITHIKNPSIGACMETGYFRALKPESLIIAYQCVSHCWIDMICNLKCSSENDVIKIIKVYMESHDIF